jgi:hypothetical protein
MGGPVSECGPLVCGAGPLATGYGVPIAGIGGPVCGRGPPAIGVPGPVIGRGPPTTGIDGTLGLTSAWRAAAANSEQEVYLSSGRFAIALASTLSKA